MAFIVEDGTGLSGATAYISAANARAYWLDVGVTFAAPDSVPSVAFPVTLQMALIAAARYMELRFKYRWKGTKQFPATTTPAFAGQGLSWPRLCVYRPDDGCNPVVGVPIEVIQANAEYMRRALVAELVTDPTIAPNITMQREKVGPLETEVQMLPYTPIFTPYPTADSLIVGLMYTGNYCVR
jgi:hypothetical protein